MAKLIFENFQPVIIDRWNADDIQSVAENMDIDLTDDQVLEIMQIIVSSHDANFGINWDVIGSAIDYILENKGGDNA
jgi:uncharacterized protein YpuA (DUF1002 family)